MFHLFNRVYLEHESWYATQYEHFLINISEGDHPVSKIAGMKVGRVPSLENFLAENFQGEIEQFWSFLISFPPDKKFIVYADQGVLDRLQLQFWKSIFVQKSVEDVYRLFKFYNLDKRLKRFISAGNKIRFESSKFRYELLPFKEFQELYNSLPVVNQLMIMDKDGLSFEYLLANHFLSPGSQNSRAFLKRLEDLSWKAFFDNIDILRGEILNSFYDVKRIIPDASFDLENVEQIESFILNEPRLKWISDENFNNKNRNYVLKNYTKENFLAITRDIALNWISNPELSAEGIEKNLLYEDHYQIIAYVFEGRFEQLLEMSIAKNFGCIFVGDSMSHKTNQILPLFIYDKIRHQKIEELEFLRFN
jgi:hypothetical protein